MLYTIVIDNSVIQIYKSFTFSPLTINCATASAVPSKLEATHLYIAELEGCASLNVNVLIRTLSLIGVLLICEESLEMTSLSVPALSIIIQVMSGKGTPSAVQENMAGSGATTLMLAGELLIFGSTNLKRQ